MEVHGGSPWITLLLIIRVTSVATEDYSLEVFPFQWSPAGTQPVVWSSHDPTGWVPITKTDFFDMGFLSKRWSFCD